MIRIRIGDSERNLSEASPQWIKQQLGARRERNEPAGIVVSIKIGSIDLVLSTPGCSTGVGGGRPLRREEQLICELWQKRGLNKADFSFGQVIAFLNEIKSI